MTAICLMREMKRTMNLNFKTVLPLLFSCYALNIVWAQSENLKRLQLEIPPEILEYQLSEFEFLDNPNSFFLNPSLLNDTTSLWIKTRIQLGAFSNRSINQSYSASDLLNPLYQKYLDSQGMKTINSILGSVSVGATAYLAYKHLKKYGFLKKK